MQILKTIINEIETASEITTQLFQSFISWGSSKAELYTDTIVCLNAIPSNNIRLSFIPRIKQFGNTANKDKEINELFRKWQKENPKLNNAINNELNN